jgi:Fur family peroxide stress response transcriptional regulator
MKTRRKRDLNPDIRAALRKKGLKVTPQREVVYDELLRSGTHPTAEQLHSKVKKRLPNVSMDTVYRTLLTLVEIGLAAVVEGDGSPRRYDPETKAHHHVHCVKCGAIKDFLSSEFDALETPKDIRKSFEVLGKRVVISGICSRCRGK